MARQRQPPMEEGCWTNNEPIIISDMAVGRVQNISEYENEISTGMDSPCRIEKEDECTPREERVPEDECVPEEEYCVNKMPPMTSHSITNQEGVNTFLEDAIISNANSVEKRVSTIVRFPGICCRTEADLIACLKEHCKCSLDCNMEVQAFSECVQEQGPVVVSTRIKSINIDKKRSTREKEISSKYNV